MLDPFLVERDWSDRAREAALEARRRTASTHQRDAHEHLGSAGWRFRGQAEGTHVYEHPEKPGQQIGVRGDGAWTHQDFRAHASRTVGRGGAVRELHRHLNGGRLL